MWIADDLDYSSNSYKTSLEKLVNLLTFYGPKASLWNERDVLDKSLTNISPDSKILKMQSDYIKPSIWLTTK